MATMWMTLQDTHLSKKNIWSTEMQRSNSMVIPPAYGNLITVLSIDGGGIRGLIPAIILEFLETELQVYRAIFV